METVKMETVKNKDGYYVVVRPEKPKVRGVIWSLILALGVPFVLGNIFVAAFWTYGGLVGDFGFVEMFKMHYKPGEYLFNILFAMFAEELIWHAGIVTYFLARTEKSFKEVLAAALFGNRGGSGNNTFIFWGGPK
jgi:membrane protease YdiL (CAAX protease family)